MSHLNINHYCHTWSWMYWLNSFVHRSISISTLLLRGAPKRPSFMFSPAEVTEEMCCSFSEEHPMPVDKWLAFKGVPIWPMSTGQKLLFNDRWTFSCLHTGSPFLALSIWRFPIGALSLPIQFLALSPNSIGTAIWYPWICHEIIKL